MSEKELSVLDKAKREVQLLDWSITTVSITAQAHQRMYHHTEQFSENYTVALDALKLQLAAAQDRLKQIETLGVEE